MTYKNNITWSESGKKQTMNFKTKVSMIKYLIKNQCKVNKLDRVYVNFGVISLPLKMTVWNNV